MFPSISKKHIEDIKYPAYAECKLDGELVMWNGYDHTLINSYGNSRSHVGSTTFPNNCILWGELYYGKGVNFYSEYQSHQKSKDLKVAWFDVVENKKRTLYGKRPYDYRRAVLGNITSKVVPSIAVSPDSVRIVFDNFVAQGYEGVVVKPTYSTVFNSWVKLKRHKSCKLYIIGIRKALDGTAKKSFAVGTAEHRYGCVSYYGWEKLILPEIAKQRIIDEDRDYWYVKPILKVEIEYQHLTPHRHMRNPFIKRLLDSREEIVLP